MTPQTLVATAQALVAGDKGLLAMDESIPTCNERFAAVGIAQTEGARRAYREMIVTTPGLGECISGAILYDETIRQHKADGTPFVQVLTDAGIIVGIKVDTGKTDLAGHPGEHVTEGLDGLRHRLTEYSQMGARFAKWRAVFDIGKGTPSVACTDANASALARYASLCQEAGLVPVVEPEVLMAGDHGLARCAAVTAEVLRAVFAQLVGQGVVLEAIVLKTQYGAPRVELPYSKRIGRGGRRHPGLPPAGRARRRAGRRLPVRRPKRGTSFFPIERFEYEVPVGRALGVGVLVRPRHPAAGPGSLGGDDANVKAAQEALYHRARCNQAARHGQYGLAMEMR